MKSLIILLFVFVSCGEKLSPTYSGYYIKGSTDAIMNLSEWNKSTGTAIVGIGETLVGFFSTGDTTTAETFHPIGIYDFPDTVKVIMLISHPLVRCVEWRHGYEVREGQMLWRVHNDGSRTPLFKITEYLDENKKPFPKSIIIWMSKEIKK